MTPFILDSKLEFQQKERLDGQPLITTSCRNLLPFFQPHGLHWAWRCFSVPSSRKAWARSAPGFVWFVLPSVCFSMTTGTKSIWGRINSAVRASIAHLQCAGFCRKIPQAGESRPLVLLRFRIWIAVAPSGKLYMFKWTKAFTETKKVSGTAGCR